MDLGAIGAIADQKKKSESGKVDFPDIAAIMQSGNTTDPWLAVFAMLAILPGFIGTSSADYWRGKYDGYKEGMQVKPKNDDALAEESDAV